MADVLRFWMRRGVDGFRVDASAVLAEDDLLRDDPPNPEYDQESQPPEKLRRIFTDDCPETLLNLADLRHVVEEFPDRVLVGEVQGATDRIAGFYGDEQCPRFHLPQLLSARYAMGCALGDGGDRRVPACASVGSMARLGSSRS
jgi:alpha-glucosidase